MVLMLSWLFSSCRPELLVVVEVNDVIVTLPPPVSRTVHTNGPHADSRGAIVQSGEPGPCGAEGVPSQNTDDGDTLNSMCPDGPDADGVVVDALLQAIVTARTTHTQTLFIAIPP